jgi:23S rRNA U2552 (ribose-2'-O)-methylase RlmE/FtsJ
MSSFSGQARTTALGRLRRASQTGWLRLPEDRPTEAAVKPTPYLPIYERLLAPLRKQPFALLELGVWNGHSLEMWRDAFPRATIVGIDLQPPELDLGPRVHVIQGDQSDAALMGRVREAHAPRGFDVIIDDASHIGVLTARSLQGLYSQHLRPGGLYCVEDWGTGYLLDWPDGGLLANRLDVAGLDRATAGARADADAASMPSHDLGLVGVVKRLVDHVASGTVAFAQPDAIGDTLAIESMSVWDGIVALRKPRS